METVRSIERAFEVLRHVALGPATLSNVADSTGLAKSTVVRLLATLERLDAVRKDQWGSYTIGRGVDELARSDDSTAALIVTVRPHLIELSAHVAEAAGFAIQVGNHVQHAVQEEAANAVQVKDYTGNLAPMHIASAGVAIMAHWPDEKINAYLEMDLARYTTNSVVEPDLIRERLERTRSVGYHWAFEEFAEGLTSMAAPVFSDDTVIGAISVHGPSYRFPAQRKEEITQHVTAAADRFSHRRRG